MKTNVSPEPSLRWTTVIVLFGRFSFGLSFAMAGSFQFVIWPR